MNSLQIINFFALVFFIWWGFVISVQDFSTNKISNKNILLGLKFLLAVFLAHLLNTYLGQKNLSEVYLLGSFYRYLFINIFFVFVSAIALWYGEVWPAGDAKFFMVSVILIPFIRNDAAGFPNYLWISILINTFVLSSIYSVIRFIYQTYTMKKEDNRNAFKELFELKNKVNNFFSSDKKTANLLKIMYTFLGLLIIFLIKQTINMYMMTYIGKNVEKPYFIYFILFFVWNKVFNIFQSKKWQIAMFALYIAYFFLGYFYFREELFSNLNRAFSNVIKFSIILTLGRFIFEYLLEKRNCYWVSVKDLKEGMIPSSRALMEFQQNKELNEYFEDYYKDGLSLEQVEAIKKWVNKTPGFNPQFEMVKGYPFAAWIFLGCLIEVLFNKSVLVLLKKI
jgi:hypothetical protein